MNLKIQRQANFLAKPKTLLGSQFSEFFSFAILNLRILDTLVSVSRREKIQKFRVYIQIVTLERYSK